MAEPATDIKTHPYVVNTPGTCGGRARIDGTRIAVWLVVASVVRGGLTPEEFIEHHPHLSLAEVYDALSYYYDHREQVDQNLRDQDAPWQLRARRAIPTDSTQK
jgi:uncharacterized protein (DUF433 family)